MGFRGSYLADIFLHPLKQLPLIFETVVVGCTFRNLLTGQEAIRSDSVIESHKDEPTISSLNDTSAVDIWITVRIEAATLALSVLLMIDLPMDQRLTLKVDVDRQF